MNWVTKTEAFGKLFREELVPLLPFVNSATLIGMVTASIEESERLHEANHRQMLHNLLRSNMREDGKTAIYVWERDCDGVEATHITWITADIEVYMELVDELYEQAEGPVYTAILSLSQAQMFTPTWRDTYAEAAGY